MANPWLERNVTGASYDARMAAKAAAGEYLHGEADFVCTLLGDASGQGAAVLDAGCGTGRLAIELARRGLEVTGVDLDRSMLEVARTKAPELDWREADLAGAGLDLGRTFDVVVAAGNVMIFLTPGTEAAVVANLARHLRDGGALVAGFQLQAGDLDLAGYDEAARAAGLELVSRWATWERRPWVEGGDYAVSVHSRPRTASV